LVLEDFEAEVATGADRDRGLVLVDVLSDDWQADNQRRNHHPHQISIERCPGMVNAPMAAFVTKNYDPEIVRRMVAQEPIGRFGEPEEIAAAVVWPCSPAASFMVGLTMTVDGGLLAG
jgi:hypothetical protein